MSKDDPPEMIEMSSVAAGAAAAADSGPKPWEKGAVVNTTEMTAEDMEIWKNKWDVIITYEDKVEDTNEDKKKSKAAKMKEIVSPRAAEESKKRAASKLAAQNKKRGQYIHRMKTMGLIVSKQRMAGDSTTVMLKITAPYSTFAAMAEEVRMDLPLKADKREAITRDRTWSAADRSSMDAHSAANAKAPKVSTFRKLKRLLLRGGDVTNAYRTFEKDTEEYFDVLDKRFFRSLDRQRVIYHVIESERWRGGCEIDLEQATSSGIFSTFYSLHTKRGQKRMAENWLSNSKFKLEQPLETIRDYFGEKIAFYFVFLSFYTRWLVYLAAGGVVTFLLQWLGDGDTGTLNLNHDVGVVYCVYICLWCSFFLEYFKRKQASVAFMFNVTDFEEIASERPKFTNRSVNKRVKGRVTEAGLIRYDEMNELTDEQRAQINEFVVWYPPVLRSVRVCMGLPIVGTFAMVVLVGTFALLALKTTMERKTFNKSTGEYEEEVKNGGIIGSILNAVFIIIMNKAYAVAAKVLNDFENYRTEVQYEDALIAKTFIFQFINSYIALFFIAFAKSDPIPDWAQFGTGGVKYTDDQLPDEFKSDAKSILGFSIGYCNQSSCMMDLFYQLAVLVVVKQLLSNLAEIGVPILKKFILTSLALRKLTKKVQQEIMSGAQESFVAVKDVFGLGDKDKDKDKDKEKADKAEGLRSLDGDDQPGAIGDAVKNGHKIEVVIPTPPFFELQATYPPFEGTFAEYNEMMIQFGYMTMFAVAFPLASVFALVNNILELKVDANKIVYGAQRAKYEGASDIGTWMKVLVFVSNAAVVTNIALVCFTSTQLRGKTRDRSDTPYRDCVMACETLLDSAEATFDVWKTNHTSNSEAWLLASDARVAAEQLDDCQTECICEGKYCMDLASRFLVFVFAEHCMFVLKLAIDRFYPDVPRNIARAMVWKDYMGDRLKAELGGEIDQEAMDGWDNSDESKDTEDTTTYTIGGVETPYTADPVVVEDQKKITIKTQKLAGRAPVEPRRASNASGAVTATTTV